MGARSRSWFCPKEKGESRGGTPPALAVSLLSSPAARREGAAEAESSRDERAGREQLERRKKKDKSQRQLRFRQGGSQPVRTPSH